MAEASLETMIPASGSRLFSQVTRFKWSAVVVLLIALTLSAYTAWGKSILDSMDAIRRDATSVEDQIAAAGKANPGACTTADTALCAKQLAINQRFEVATHHLASWAFFLRDNIPWLEKASSSGQSDSESQAQLVQRQLDVEQKRRIEWTTAFMTVMGNYILPSIYGWLGALAFVLRRFNDRLANSLLTDRDHSANTVRLALGAAIGSSIGLVYSGTGVAQLSGMLGQAVTLSASSIAFFAGYGVEAVFKMIDAMIEHVFHVGADQNGR